MKKRLIAMGLMIFMVLSLLSVPGLPVQAEENKDLDLIMVLDQSGSMKRNDPNGMMRTAANMMVEMLPSRASRVGVISFNRKQTRVAGLTELSDENNVDDIIKKVKKIEYEGDTDIGNAVADAIEMFDPSDGRIHAILVLSDGKNEFKLEKNKEKESDERLNDALIQAKKQNCLIYCLGFGGELADQNGKAYKKLSEIATSEDTISTENDPGNIHRFFVNMLANLIGGAVDEITDNRIFIKSNVKEANIYLSSPESLDKVEVTLSDPDGKNIELKNSDALRYYKDTYSAVIKMYAPAPGEYIIGTTTDKIDISVGYVASYEYLLSSKVLDGSGSPIESIDNGKSATLRVAIQQDGKDIGQKEVYDELNNAQAVVKAKDTGEEETIPLSYNNGALEGRVDFDHVAAFEITSSVDDDSFHLTDTVTVVTNKRGITQEGASSLEIEKKVIDKTFKKSKVLLVDRDELMSIISDPDQVGVEIAEVQSSDEDKVTADITDQGILLTGRKWGSANVDVTYKDGLGNTIQTAFTVKVVDKLMVALFAALPVLIILLVVLIIYLVMRQSRTIKGDIIIERVSIAHPDHSVSVVGERISYRAKTFVGRKKTLGNGMNKYIQDVNARESSEDSQMLYRLFTDSQSQIRKNLDEFKFVGTYLGLKGCSIKVKKGAMIAVSNINAYGKAVRLSWPGNATFRVYTKDGSGIELCIEGAYHKAKTQKQKPKKGRKSKGKGAPAPDPADFGNDFDGNDFFD